MMKTITLTGTIPESLAHERLDVALARLFSDYSRAQIQRWIREGAVTVDQHVVQKTRFTVSTGQVISVSAALIDQTQLKPQCISLSIVYEDDAIIVINKPVGLVVHPGAGNKDNTLVNALLYHAPELATLPRAGIIHRLDKDTSGLLVIARTLSSHHTLVTLLQQRKIHREYRALVHGVVISGGSIDAPIARHSIQRTKMAIVETGKPAITHYRVLERFDKYTLLSVTLETGRTHQIRVHLSHMGYPLVGDSVYTTRHFQSAQPLLSHQALHAYQLKLNHPVTNNRLEWTAPLPEDMGKLIKHLRIHTQINTLIQR